jgi:hypothetical protein
MKEYTSKTGLKLFKPSASDLLIAIELDNGFCLACGAENEGIEQDARKYKCDCCDKSLVYGAEQLLLMNLYH